MRRRLGTLVEAAVGDVQQHAPDPTPSDVGGLTMPSSKPRRRELPTRTPGVYRDSLTGTYIVRIRVAGRAIKASRATPRLAPSGRTLPSSRPPTRVRPRRSPP